MPPHPHRPSSRVTRALWLALACVSLAVGVVGIVVPVLPTVPFVLLAAFAAARGSPRLHAWLRDHRLFGPMLRDWERERAVSRRAKWAATGTMLAGAVILVLVGTHPGLALAACVALAAVATWLWMRPEPGART